MNNEQIDNILALHFSGEKMSEEQENVLLNWICENKSEYHRLSLLMENVQKTDGATFDAARAWKKISPRLQRKKTFRLTPLARYVSYAASIVLIAGISLFLLNKNDSAPLSFTNATADLMALTLPDSSEVTLYPNAKLTYRADAGGAERNTTLEGKAFFRVSKNPQRPFVVKNFDTSIKVLGTSFLVDGSKATISSVQVRNGKVKVSSGNHSVMLTANEQAVVTRGNIKKSEIAQPGEIFQPHARQKSYQNVPLTDIVKDIVSEFDVQIALDHSLQEVKITTTIQFTELEEVLSDICYICNGRYFEVGHRSYRLKLGN